MKWCIVVQHDDSFTIIEVHGPFDTEQAAIDWANANESAFAFASCFVEEMIEPTGV